MMTANSQPLLLSPSESRTPEVLDVLGIPTLVKISGKDTNEQFAMFYVPVPPMSGPPLHRHTREDECFYILEGEITWEINGRRYSGGVGTTAFAPRGSIHTFQNFGNTTARMLVTVAPAGLDRFFEEIHQSNKGLAEPNFEEAGRIMESYGIEVLGPPLG